MLVARENGRLDGATPRRTQSNVTAHRQPHGSSVGGFSHVRPRTYPHQVTAPQLRYYAQARAGLTAIIDTESGQIMAWIVRDGDQMRARRGTWVSEAAQTVAEVIGMVALAVDRAVTTSPENIVIPGTPPGT